MSDLPSLRCPLCDPYVTKRLVRDDHARTQWSARRFSVELINDTVGEPRNSGKEASIVYGRIAEQMVLAMSRKICRCRADLLEYFHRYTVIPMDSSIAWTYGRLSRESREAGNRIGDNDLWIAATAIERAIPLLTKNTDHFNRIAELEVRTY